MANWLDTLFGVTPAYADAASIQPKGVKYNESRGASPQKLLTPGPSGELGPYQLTPKAWEDLQRVYPQYKTMDFFKTATNEPTAKTAMMDYMSILDGYLKAWGLPNTDANILQSYNGGPGDFRNGERNPEYVRTYRKGI